MKFRSDDAQPWGRRISYTPFLAALALILATTTTLPAAAKTARIEKQPGGYRVYDSKGSPAGWIVPRGDSGAYVVRDNKGTSVGTIQNGPLGRDLIDNKGSRVLTFEE